MKVLQALAVVLDETSDMGFRMDSRQASFDWRLFVLVDNICTAQSTIDSCATFTGTSTRPVEKPTPH